MPRGTDRRDEAMRQGRLWTPFYDRGRLLAWHAMDIGGSPITYATGISNLKDLSGRGNDATQGTGANQPTLDNSNYRRKAVFTASTQSLQILNSTDANTYLAVTAAWTMAVLFDRQGTASFPVAYGTSQVAVGSGREIYLDSATSYRIGYGNNGSAINSTVQADIGTLRIAIVTNTTAGLQTLRVDGAQGAQGTTTGNGTVTTAHQINGKANLAMNFYEGLTATATYSTAECERLEGYLAWKWGLVSQLPASHRFRNRPPLIGD